MASRVPSGLNATLVTLSRCLVRVWVQRPCSISHNRTVWSPDALVKETEREREREVLGEKGERDREGRGRVEREREKEK